MEYAVITKHHEELGKLAGAFAETVRVEPSEFDAATSLSALQTFAGLLISHLGYEDDLMYPMLRNHPNTEIQDVAKEAELLMDSIKEFFGAYAERWNSAEAIDADPELFKMESEELLKSLTSRIEYEEERLFPHVRKALHLVHEADDRANSKSTLILVVCGVALALAVAASYYFN